MSDTNLVIKIQADVKSLEVGTKKATKSIKNFSKNTTKHLKTASKSQINFMKILETGLGFGLANIMQSALVSVKEFVVDSLKTYIDYERGLTSLNIQTKNTADTLIKELQRASNYTVSAFDAMQSANKALALGISKTQLPKLMEVATARAKVMGITATQAFSDISVGIGRQSRMILDNLGIILDMDKAYLNYKETLEDTSRGLTEFEKKQAITAQILTESEGLTFAMSVSTADLKTGVEQLTASFSELKLMLGTELGTEIKWVIEVIDAFNLKVGDTVLTEKAEIELRRLGDEYLELSTNANSATESIRGLQSQLSSIVLSDSGERQTKELEKQQEVDKARLDLKELEKQKESELDILVEQTGLDRSKLEEFLSEKLRDQLESKESLLNGLNDELEIIRLKNDISQRELDIEVKKEQSRQKIVQYGEADLETAVNSIKQIGTRFNAEVELKKEIVLKLADINEELLTQKNITEELTSQEILYRRMRTWFRMKPGELPSTNKDVTEETSKDYFGEGFQNDFISRPGLGVTSFSPQDTIIGVKNPGAIGGSNINVYIESVNGLDADVVAEALQEQLSTMIS